MSAEAVSNAWQWRSALLNLIFDTFRFVQLNAFGASKSCDFIKQSLASGRSCKTCLKTDSENLVRTWSCLPLLCMGHRCIGAGRRCMVRQMILDTAQPWHDQQIPSFHLPQHEGALYHLLYMPQQKQQRHSAWHCPATNNYTRHNSLDFWDLSWEHQACNKLFDFARSLPISASWFRQVESKGVNGHEICPKEKIVQQNHLRDAVQTIYAVWHCVIHCDVLLDSILRDFHLVLVNEWLACF